MSDSKPSIARTDKGRFVKGAVSPNPGGRPKETAEVRELARQHTDEAIATLAEIMGDTAQPPAARVAAASALLDRGYGKAPQSMEIDARYAFPGEEMVLVTRAGAAQSPALGSGDEN